MKIVLKFWEVIDLVIGSTLFDCLYLQRNQVICTAYLIMPASTLFDCLYMQRNQVIRTVKFGVLIHLH